MSLASEFLEWIPINLHSQVFIYQKCCSGSCLSHSFHETVPFSFWSRIRTPARLQERSHFQTSLIWTPRPSRPGHRRRTRSCPTRYRNQTCCWPTWCFCRQLVWALFCVQRAEVWPERRAGSRRGGVGVLLAVVGIGVLVGTSRSRRARDDAIRSPRVLDCAAGRGVDVDCRRGHGRRRRRSFCLACPEPTRFPSGCRRGHCHVKKWMGNQSLLKRTSCMRRM